ncbi:MAG TPA: aconitase family protein, partial [Gemmatimonadales bacterium]|nr:aconitase family protein [Gemmatimonadales bacterium]
MTRQIPDPFRVRTTLQAGGDRGAIYSLPALARQGEANLDRLPFSIRVLLENALRFAGHGIVTEDHVRSLGRWAAATQGRGEIPFMPARVVLQDFTGVPCVVDLAAMRDAMARMHGDPQKINPIVPCDLVIDHSVQVDHYGSPSAF